MEIKLNYSLVNMYMEIHHPFQKPIITCSFHLTRQNFLRNFYALMGYGDGKIIYSSEGLT